MSSWLHWEVYLFCLLIAWTISLSLSLCLYKKKTAAAACRFSPKKKGREKTERSKNG
jgi:hypothetical protein